MIQAQNLRQIKVRIKSIQNTRKITKAMEMVSASKLNKVKALFFSTKNYVFELEAMLNILLSDAPNLISPLLEEREKINSCVICVVTSDTGLCGTYNYNVIKCAEQFMKTLNRPHASIVAVGRDGYNHFRKIGTPIMRSYLGAYGRFTPELSDGIANDLVNMFLRREADEVYIAYSQFRTSLRHVPIVQKLLNIDTHKTAGDYRIFEPSAQDILNSITSKYIIYKARSIFLEAFTSEHSARMLAMKTATDNADDLTGQLTLARNKARQFAITKEVLEIAASAEALKG